MRERSPLRERIVSGESVTLVMSSTGDPFVVEACALAGFDGFVLDMEHAAIDDVQAQSAIRAGDAFSLPVLVRLALHDRARVGRFLDAGGSGVIFAHVSTHEELDEVVALTRLPPQGQRGASAVRASGHGSVATNADWAAAQNARVLVAAQIEDAAGTNLAREIADRVDAIVMGPRDLSFDLGVPGEVSHPSVEEAIERVRGACTEHGTAYGSTANPDRTRDPDVAIGMVNLAALIRHAGAVVTANRRPSDAVA